MFHAMQSPLTTKDDYRSLPQYNSSDALSNMLENALIESLDREAKPPGENFTDPAFESFQEFGAHTYEDILATAVLNKVLEKCDHGQEFSGEGSLELVGTDTDSGLSGSIGGDALKRMGKNLSEGVSEDSSSPFCDSPKDDYAVTSSAKISVSPPLSLESPDAGVGMERTSRGSSGLIWSIGKNEVPFQLKIEEHIEEVTTHQLTDDDESNCSYNNDSENLLMTQNGQPKSTYAKRLYATKVVPDEEPQVLPAFGLPSITGDNVFSNRVPFPELGMDLLQESSSTTDGGPSELVLENINWKENWLFRKETPRGRDSTQTIDPINMLIPNPSSNVGPTIGDRDIDELSELSDRHSTYSFDTSSDDEYGQNSSTNVPTVASKDLVELVGEINAEFGQKDHEYTEDVSALDRLQMINTYSNSQNLTTHLDTEEMTGVTPVFKQRKYIAPNKSCQMNVRYLAKEKVLQSLDKNSRNKLRHSQTPVRSDEVLTPPQVIPPELDVNKTSSSSVWFESVLEDQVVPVGRTLRLKCQVHSRQICGVSWFFRNEILKDDRDILTWRRGDTYVLNVFEMGSYKAGTYYVGAYTKDDCVWSRCEVTCVDQGRAKKSPQVTLNLRDVTVEKGSDVIVECQVGGHPEPRVTFMRDSLTLLPYSGDCFIENDQYGTWILQLKEVKEEDSGQIKALASNSVGHATSFCTIKVVPEGSYFHPNSEKESSQNYHKKKKPGSHFSNNRTRDAKANSSTPALNNEINKESSNRGYVSPLINSPASYHTYPYMSNHTDNSNFDYTMDENNHGNLDITINGCMFQPPKPGTIAEREHRKWLEAKPLPNNPYSAEKLVDRLGKSPHRFPSLPTVYRDTSGDEGIDTNLRDCLLSSSSDLSRYSRDYHVLDKISSKPKSMIYNEVNKKSEFVRPEHRRPTTCLVKIEAQQAADWKEELKDIKLDVGKKVADIQKTIDKIQHDWKRRMDQRGFNPSPPSTRHRNHDRGGQKLSASCINLTSPPKSKAFVSSYRNRHLVYSSTEALNRDQSHNNLWRTVSVDTLNPPFKESFPHSDYSNGHHLYPDKSYASRDLKREELSRTFSGPPLSDSDDSSIPNATYCINKTMMENTHQNGYSNRRMSSYYSENSIESLKEESDTENSLPIEDNSLPIEDNSNMPSVKELAYKFDSLKNTKNKVSSTKKYHEVHHSLTARSVSRSFREGLRNHSHRKPQTPLDPLTDDSTRYNNQDSHRDTSSPEHLGIPSSPASIPTRSYAYPTAGDTSDDSVIGVLIPRKNYRKRNAHANSSKCNNNNNNNINNNNNNVLKQEQYII